MPFLLEKQGFTELTTTIEPFLRFFFGQDGWVVHILDPKPLKSALFSRITLDG